MFWDNPSDPKWLQRLKNNAFLKMPVTNETRDAGMPGVMLIAGILLVVFVVSLIAGNPQQ